MIGMEFSHGQFRISEKIGEGGFATVFRGTQLKPARSVAIKVLSEELANSNELVTRFHNEAAALASFDHPHIMKIYSEGEEHGLHYFVANLLKEDLKVRLKRGRMSLKDSLRVLRQVTDALDYMHRKGFIHRDFKPANILFDETDNAVLTDFGLARGQQSTLVTQQGMILGTAAYMAPEQIHPGPQAAEARSDLYALGCVMFEMVEGHPPFPQDDFFTTCHNHLYTAAPPMLEPEAPESLRVLLASLLAKTPAERPASAEVVLDEIVAAELELASRKGAPRRGDGRSSAAAPPPAPVASTPAAPAGIAKEDSSAEDNTALWSVERSASAAPAAGAPAHRAAPASEETAISMARFRDPVSEEKTAVPTPGSPGKSAARGKGLRIPLIVGFAALAFVIALAAQWVGRSRSTGAGAAAGRLVVVVTPADAVGALDGKPLPGLQPFELSALPRGEHALELNHAGFRTEHRTVRPPGSGTDTLHIALVQDPAPVSPPAGQAMEHPSTASNAGGSAQVPSGTSGNPATSSRGGTARTPVVRTPEPGIVPPARPPASTETRDPQGVGAVTVVAVDAEGRFVTSAVSLDGESSDEQTPCTLRDLASGAHRVRVHSTGYRIVGATVDGASTPVDGEDAMIVIKPVHTLKLRVVLARE